MADFDYRQTNQPKPGSSSYLGAVDLTNSGTLATGALALNKTSAILRVPKGFVCTGFRFRIGDGDSNGTPLLAFKIGDSGDDDRFLAASTLGQAGGETNTLEDAGFLYEFTADTDILLTCSTAAATAQAAAFKIALRGYMK
jgi:hypothetical protein